MVSPLHLTFPSLASDPSPLLVSPVCTGTSSTARPTPRFKIPASCSWSPSPILVSLASPSWLPNHRSGPHKSAGLAAEIRACSSSDTRWHAPFLPLPSWPQQRVLGLCAIRGFLPYCLGGQPSGSPRRSTSSRGHPSCTSRCLTSSDATAVSTPRISSVSSLMVTEPRRRPESPDSGHRRPRHVFSCNTLTKFSQSKKARNQSQSEST